MDGRDGTAPGQPLDLLGERGLGARLLTAELAHPQIEHDPLPTDRGIDQMPPVPAVHPARERAAPRACHPAPGDMRPQAQQAIRLLGLINLDVRQTWKQDREAREVTQ
jgi:hypothetical protein